MTATTQLAAAQIRRGRLGPGESSAEAELQSVTALVDMLERAEICPDLATATATLTALLREHTACREVVLGLTSSSAPPCRISAISGRGQFDRHSEHTRAIEAVLDEAVVAGSLTVHSAGAASRPARRAHQRLLETMGAGRLISAPLVDRQGVTHGAWLFVFDPVTGKAANHGTATDEAPGLRLLQAAGSRVAACLGLLQRAERGPIVRSWRTTRSLVRRRKGQAILAAIALGLAALLIPAPHQVKCDCELQPLRRCYVAAPFDARLEKALVEPGDVIEPGQRLAQLDGREIRWELAAVTADVQRAEKQRDGHLATHEFGPAEVSRFEAQSLLLKQRLLEHRSQNLEIRSPIGGIVISGDLRKTEGAPLQEGQTMFEIGPLDKLLVEVAIAQDDMAFVSPGMDVEFVLDALPNRRWQGTLERVHPRSEIKDQRHVFIGDVLVDNSAELLRPGMCGQAAIACPSRPLGWVLFHKPWEKLTVWLAW